MNPDNFSIDWNKNNLDAINKNYVNPKNYENYQKTLNSLSKILKNDASTTDLKHSLTALLEEIKLSDWKVDHSIEYNIQNIIGEGDIAIVEEYIKKMQTEILSEQTKLESIKAEYEKEKKWIINEWKQAHQVLYHTEQLSSLSVEELKDYEDSLSVEIKDSINDIRKIAQEARKKDPHFWDNLLWWEDYMESMDDKDNAEELTFKAINETINYINSFVNSNSLEMSLPWNVWNITFKNKADKLFYSKTFLDTLKTWVDDEHNSISFLKIWLIWWSVAWGFLLIHKIFKSLNPITAALNFWKKIFSKWKWKTETSNETKVDTSSETKADTTSKEKVEKSSKYVSREKMKSYVKKVEEKYLEKGFSNDPTLKELNEQKYNSMSNEIRKLKNAIKEWKFDKLSKLQFWEILNHLATNRYLPKNIIWKFWDYTAEKIWNNIWDYARSKIEKWANPIKINNERNINIKRVVDFLEELWKKENKIAIDFWWETIEVKESVKMDLQKIEENFKQIEKLEKVEDLKIELGSAEKDLKIIEGNKKLTPAIIGKNLNNPTFENILKNESAKIKEIKNIKLEYAKMRLWSTIEKIDIQTEINLLTTEIDKSIIEVETKLNTKTIGRIWTKANISRFKSIQKAIIKALKK